MPRKVLGLVFFLLDGEGIPRTGPATASFQTTSALAVAVVCGAVGLVQRAGPLFLALLMLLLLLEQPQLPPSLLFFLEL